jgi:phosphoribosyl 1,2-cyclic phosphodiesterase
MEPSGGIRVTFWGVRGSTPCEGAQYTRYGGHSSCVSLEYAGEPPVVFDLGTGLTPYGVALGGNEARFNGTVLLTHLHWDHVQGLPFFSPLFNPRSTMDVYGPRQQGTTLGDTFDGLMCPPYFPVRARDLPAEVRFHDAGDDSFAVGTGAKVRSRFVRHVGATLGFRVDWHGASVAYIADHGQGCGEPAHDEFIPHAVLELCDGVDLLIHDAQHTGPEFENKRHWGHCTHDYALHVAHEAGAKQVALFHHDPAHGDEAVDDILAATLDRSDQRGGPDVVAAAEDMVIDLGGLGSPGTAGESLEPR